MEKVFEGEKVWIATFFDVVQVFDRISRKNFEFKLRKDLLRLFFKTAFSLLTWFCMIRIIIQVDFVNH